MEIGIIGLGVMGMPMLERMTGAGFRVGFYARKPDAISAATAMGAVPQASPQQLAANVDLLILCLYSDLQVRDIVLGQDGVAANLKPGATLVIHTTGSPATAREIANVVAGKGCHVMDVPVSGGPHNIRAGTITLLAGGDSEVLERCRPVLASYGNPILHAGPLGSGQAVKLVNNLLFGANVDLVAEASRILRELGIAPAPAFQAIAQCSGESRVLEMAIRSGSIEALQESAGRFIDKDRAVAREVAAEMGVDIGLLDTGSANRP